MADKYIICVDFDGVIHSYTSKWVSAELIPDPPVPGAILWLREATQHFEVNIFSSRSHQPGGRLAMKSYIEYHAAMVRMPLDWIEELKFPLEKPPALVTIDDRAITFNGKWNEFSMDRIKSFKPWNKA